MKHVITLISALVFMSATVNADDIKRNKKHNSKTVAVAPFVWGDPSDEAPSDLESYNSVKAQVPVAPFVWGDPSDEAPADLKAHNSLKGQVPVAPFVWGDPNELPQVVEAAKVRNTSVPVAPFVYGNPEDEITRELKTSLAVQLIK